MSQLRSGYWPRLRTLDGLGSGGVDAIAGLTPETIEGLDLWLDASDAATITKDESDRVSAWNDKSSRGNHFTQGTGGNQPLWVDDVQNSLPVIRADDTNRFLAGPSPFFADGTTARTLIFVGSLIGSLTAGTFQNSIICLGEQQTNGQAYIYDGRNDVDFHGEGPQFPGLFTTTFAMFSVVTQAGTVEGSTRLWQAALELSVSGYDGSGNPAINTAGASKLFTGKSQPTTCNLGEILVYSAALSDTQRVTLEQYLKAKWDVSDSGPE